VLAVGVVCFVHRSAPHDPEARRRDPSRRPAKEAELQVVTEVADVPILHLITIEDVLISFQPDHESRFRGTSEETPPFRGFHRSPYCAGATCIGFVSILRAAGTSPRHRH
jgi:hypothetical protein